MLVGWVMSSFKMGWVMSSLFQPFGDTDDPISPGLAYSPGSAFSLGQPLTLNKSMRAGDWPIFEGFMLGHKWSDTLRHINS
jgi:hypothetical protein